MYFIINIYIIEVWVFGGEDIFLVFGGTGWVIRMGLLEIEFWIFIFYFRK